MTIVLQQDSVLKALSRGAETDPFLGNVVELAIVTGDHKRTMDGLLKLGIGPWRVYKFSPENTENQTYKGKPVSFELIVCFAQSGNMVWELMEPVSGPTIFADFLKAHGEGIHHVAYDCNNIPFEERIAEFERRGFKKVQSGSWMGRNHFAFFGTEEDTTTCFETYAFPDDWDYPEPDSWYPPLHD
ncbi:VOC family protein [Agrobacterium vitis]|uniref:VOC family protein n=1 Tax=Rhizobium/Agrobacterium group TaxID=227290 RepID=UPI0012E8B1F6|nr:MULTISPECIES: VOC family protein [Rhizobium/Agrobacterium group]MCF1494380.1 VOC family protein [Allorhizobium ampelinum]MUZ66334.1 VOC family protein [Agrobacterium vitis]MVA45886.1 VOC family protein [Agrobacterium vitis]